MCSGIFLNTNYYSILEKSHEDVEGEAKSLSCTVVPRYIQHDTELIRDDNRTIPDLAEIQPEQDKYCPTNRGRGIKSLPKFGYVVETKNMIPIPISKYILIVMNTRINTKNVLMY